MTSLAPSNPIHLKQVCVVAMGELVRPKVSVQELLPNPKQLRCARRLATGGGYAQKTSFLARFVVGKVETATVTLFGHLH